MVFHAELIVLSFTKIKENALVLHCLSREWGRRGFITSVSKTAGTALFQPLSILDAEVVENPRSDLWRLRGISAKYGLNGIRASMVKNSMTMFMSEVLYRTIHDGDTEDGLYDWCRRSILTLDALEGEVHTHARRAGRRLRQLPPALPPRIRRGSRLLPFNRRPRAFRRRPLQGDSRARRRGLQLLHAASAQRPGPRGNCRAAAQIP